MKVKKLNSDAVCSALGNLGCYMLVRKLTSRFDDGYTHSRVVWDVRVRLEEWLYPTSKGNECNLGPKESPLEGILGLEHNRHQWPYVAVGIHGQQSECHKRQVE